MNTQTNNEAGAIVNYFGVDFSGGGARKFCKIKCPCGVVVEYPVNGLPEVDTPHPCGNKNHWTVKYDNDALLRADANVGV